MYVWWWVRHGTLGWNSFKMHFLLLLLLLRWKSIPSQSHLYGTNVNNQPYHFIWNFDLFRPHPPSTPAWNVTPVKRYTPFAYLCAICKTCKSIQWRCSETKRAIEFPFDIEASQAFIRSITPYWNRTSADIYFIFLGDAKAFRFANHVKNMSERTAAMHFLWSP